MQNLLFEKLRGVYVVTDSVIFPERGHVEISKASAAGGTGCIQLREKESSDEEFLEIARKMKEAISGSGAIFIINDRVDAALECGADGLHIGQDDLHIAFARAALGPDSIIGVSVSTVEEAIKAEADGASYIGAGPIFETSTKLDACPAIGLEALSAIKRAVNIPVVAIGGISLANIADVAAAGADSAAVVSAVVCAPDMAEAVKELNKEFKKGLSSR